MEGVVFDGCARGDSGSSMVVFPVAVRRRGPSFRRAVGLLVRNGPLRMGQICVRSDMVTNIQFG